MCQAWFLGFTCIHMRHNVSVNDGPHVWQVPETIVEPNNCHRPVTAWPAPRCRAMPSSCVCGDAGVNRPALPFVAKGSTYSAYLMTKNDYVTGLCVYYRVLRGRVFHPSDLTVSC